MSNKMTLKMVRDAKALGPMNPGGTAHIYANVAARGGLDQGYICLRPSLRRYNSFDTKD